MNLVAGTNVGEIFDVGERDIGIAGESHPADVRHAARDNMELQAHLLQRGSRKLLVSDLGLIVAVFFQQAVHALQGFRDPLRRVWRPELQVGRANHFIQPRPVLG